MSQRRVVVLVVAAFQVFGNIAIAVASVVVRRRSPNEPLPPIAGVRHLLQVDHRVWRSSAPSRQALRTLIERGVRTIVDLRAERYLRDDEQMLTASGVELLRLPIRDGQTPTRSQLVRALATIETSDGVTLIHCGAGVGRTGALAGAYLVRRGTSGAEALRRNLAVGPPSLEQLWYVGGLDDGFAPPNIVIKAVSRFLDAPRRTWSRVRHAVRWAGRRRCESSASARRSRDGFAAYLVPRRSWLASRTARQGVACDAPGTSR